MKVWSPGKCGGECGASGWPVALRSSTLPSTTKTTIRTAAPRTRRGNDLVKSAFLLQAALLLRFPWLWWSHTVCEVGFACARQNYGSRSWSDAKWAPFIPSASPARLCRGGTVAVEREDPDPGVVWHFDPAETVFQPLKLVPIFRAARRRDMWQWEALRVWRRRRQNYLQLPLRWKDDDGRG